VSPDDACVLLDRAERAEAQLERYRQHVYRYGTRDSHRFWLCKLMPYLWALRFEWPRILDWRQRHRDGRRYSWIEAWRAVAENPPVFDHFWDQEMEGRCYCSQGIASCFRIGGQEP
jgi:hypothetical protein